MENSFIKSLIDEKKNTYLKRLKKNMMWSFWLKLLVTIFTATTTILLGISINKDLEWFVKTFALLLSSTVTIIVAIQNFFDFEPLWTKYTSLVGMLNDIEIEYNFRTERNELDDEYLKKTFERIKEIDLNLYNYLVEIRQPVEIK